MDFDIDFYKENCKNKNTVKATTTWITKYKRWAVALGEPEDLELLEPIQANDVLERYFCSVTKETGGQYEPASLCSIQAAIERYLREKNCRYSVMRDKELQGCRDVLEGKARFLRQELGMGKKPNKAESLSLEDEEVLWSCGQLGDTNARSLLNTVWFLLTQHFGLRGRQEHYVMKVGDFQLKKDDNGITFITFSESFSKTRQGGLRQKERAVRPKMFATGNERCPVDYFLKFLSRRPGHLQESGFLYLAVIDNPTTETWYKCSRLGINSINNIMKNMVKKTPLALSGKKLTNHSARKTVVKKLKKARIQKSDIIGITGHSNEAGLDPYDSGDEQQQKEYSYAIDNIPTCSSSFQKQTAAPKTPLPSLRVFQKDSLPPKQFKFFSDEVYEKIGGQPAPPATMNFHNCTVYIGSDFNKPSNCCEQKRRKRVRFISSSGESSQEQQ